MLISIAVMYRQRNNVFRRFAPPMPKMTFNVIPTWHWCHLYHHVVICPYGGGRVFVLFTRQASRINEILPVAGCVLSHRKRKTTSSDPPKHPLFRPTASNSVGPFSSFLFTDDLSRSIVYSHHFSTGGLNYILSRRHGCRSLWWLSSVRAPWSITRFIAHRAQRYTLSCL